MLVALMQRDPHVPELVTDIVPEVFPWVTFLSRDEVREFVVGLTSPPRDRRSCSGDQATIESWRHTAEVLADPELAAVLAQSSDDDHRQVPAPGG
jgi:hypothetical protein